MPTTSYPSDFNSAAVAEESTPPDMATTILVSCGRPSRSRLLSMVPVIDFSRDRPFGRLATSVEKAFDREGLGALPKKADGPGRDCPRRPLFNIGRIPPKQSADPAFREVEGRQILPPRAKRGPQKVFKVPAPSN